MEEEKSRLTEMTLDELLEIEKRPKSEYNRAQLRLRIAEFLYETGEDQAKAETTIRKWLSSSDTEDLMFAFQVFIDFEYLDEETYKKMKKAASKPENREAINNFGHMARILEESWGIIPQKTSSA